MNDPVCLLHVAEPGEAFVLPEARGRFTVETCTADEASACLAAGSFAALAVSAAWPQWSDWCGRMAVLLVQPEATPDAAGEAARMGAQDLVGRLDVSSPAWAGRVLAAIERQRALDATRQAYATDLLTGLPHERQLVEHMSHLLALREREPSPMALLVLRVEGFATAQARWGSEAAGVLRRKVAVRLRAGVRASDVVASLGEDSFGVLLSSIEAQADAAIVGRKLLTALSGTFPVMGQECAIAVAIGTACHPADGTQPEALLARASGLAASAPAQGREGFANFAEGGRPTAAND